MNKKVQFLPLFKPLISVVHLALRNEHCPVSAHCSWSTAHCSLSECSLLMEHCYLSLTFLFHYLLKCSSPGSTTTTDRARRGRWWKYSRDEAWHKKMLSLLLGEFLSTDDWVPKGSIPAHTTGVKQVVVKITSVYMVWNREWQMLARGCFKTKKFLSSDC